MGFCFVVVQIVPTTNKNRGQQASPAVKEVVFNTYPLAVPRPAVFGTPYRVGVSVNRCQDALFDKISMGPVGLMETTHSLHYLPSAFEVAARSMEEEVSYGPMTCTAAKGFLSRQNLCVALYPTDGGAQSRCINQFCSSCTRTC